MYNANGLLFRPRTLTKHCAAILDLDGTIANNDHRAHLLPARDEDGGWSKSTQKDWDDYHEELHDDTLDQHVYNMFCYLCSSYSTIRRVVISSRDVSNQAAIVKWLHKNNVDVDEMYLRNNDDHRPAHEYKMDVINHLRSENLQVMFAFEDEEINCKTFTENNIYTYKITMPGGINVYKIRKVNAT